MSIPAYEIFSHFSINYLAFLRSGIFAEYLKMRLVRKFIFFWSSYFLRT